MFSRKSLPLLVVFLAAPLVAQDKDKLCNDIQNRPMRVGQWASYTWTGGRSDKSTMRFALVGTEPVDGKVHYWYEMVITEPDKGPKGKTIIQMLVPGLGFQAADGLRGLILKSGEDAAMRMPDQMVRMMGGRIAGRNIAAEIARACKDMDIVGWEQVSVPAGTFRALHVRNAEEQTEAWVVPDVYFGLVRVKTKDGATMELAGRGGDAKSSITETPRTAPH